MKLCSAILPGDLKPVLCLKSFSLLWRFLHITNSYKILDSLRRSACYPTLTNYYRPPLLSEATGHTLYTLNLSTRGLFQNLLLPFVLPQARQWCQVKGRHMEYIPVTYNKRHVWHVKGRVEERREPAATNRVQKLLLKRPDLLNVLLLEHGGSKFFRFGKKNWSH